jgi:iron complex outermembrane receptor protein
MKAQRNILTISFAFLILCSAVCVTSNTANAETLKTATISGVVVDHQGNALPNANLSIANTVVGYTRVTSSGADGTFRFAAVPINEYQFYASAAGFAVSRASIAVKSEAIRLRTTLLPQTSPQSSAGTLKGSITLGDGGNAVHGATVTILQLRRTTYTDESGNYEFQSVPPGTYDVSAHLSGVPDAVQSVEVKASNASTLNIQLHLSGMKEQVTVTATGTQQAVSSSIQSVDVIGSTDLAKKNPASLGAALESEAGVSKRSFGPGTERPVIRGFDGDRVLVLQDGNRIGALGFESGDHAEPIDLLTVERVEVVKGPATLLYGSSAIGGVVNVIEGHDAARKGATGYLSGIGSSNNNQVGVSGGIEYGTGPWLVWGNGGGQRSGDYKTKLGVVPNSFSRNYGLGAGVGYFAGKGFFSGSYQMSRLRYGIPFDPADPAAAADAVHLTPSRDSFKFNGGFREGGSFIEAGNFSFQYNRYRHSEITTETGTVNTSFKNNTFLYSGMLDQKKRGKLSGRFGFWGLHRAFEASGEEALAPPTKQNAIAGFALETIDFEHASLQFGGRIENNRYNPTATAARGVLPNRSFTGFSGAVGLRVPTWTGGAFVVNFSRSYRAPALEELYNDGPHGGNVTFEIGDPALKRELSNGLDFGIRHSSKRVRAEANGFYYHINGFVFLAPTGAVDVDSGLNIANYEQGTSRFFGTEAKLDFQLHPKVWLNLGTDYVNAELTATSTPLPRIPPLRGRVGLELHLVKSLILNPEVVMANHQDKIFTIETPTAGYTVFNLAGSYLIARQHTAHIITFNAFNLGDRVYRNHLSFIKDFAPEMGRGVRVTYTVRFF